jgi:CheY-like chemotaxis protein
MFLIDKHIDKARALVIDSNAASRSVMIAQLRDLGVGHVKPTGRIADARLLLEQRSFDIVLCDYHFDGGMSGQDLLDELRREHLLPYSTVFIMITGDATYAKVVEAAESALDGYLLKPYTAATLADRLTEARKRKRTMKDAFEALEKDEIERAIELCLQRFQKREPYALLAARVAGELLLRANRHEQARWHFDQVLKAHDAPWARLGIARALLAAGEITPARRCVEMQVRQEPGYAETYDVLGRLQVDQGELAAALQTYRTVSQATPGCMLRLQHCGTLAFYQGESAEALRLLERTVSMGLKSKLFDALTLMLTGLLRFDAHDTKGLMVTMDYLDMFITRHPDSLRLQRFVKATAALRHICARQFSEAMVLARELAAECQDVSFDLEAANVALALWVRIPEDLVAPGELGTLARRIGLRFCVSKAVAEVLIAASRRQEAVAGVIRACQAEINAMAEQAMTYTVRGKPRAAVLTLLSQGAETRNAKLIEMAGLVVKRHQDTIADEQTLRSKSDELHQRYCRPITHIAGFRRTGRSPGGLIMRA